MTEKEIISASIDGDLKDRLDSIANNRSEAVNEALERYIRNSSSKEQRLEQIDEEIEEIEEKQEQLETQKRGLEAEKAQLEKELELEEEKREKYDELVDELAERKENGYSVTDSEKFDRAVGLSEYSGELAVERVLEEIRAEADVDDTDEEVIEETADDYDFDISELNGGDNQ